jgi:hypothetical protein
MSVPLVKSDIHQPSKPAVKATAYPHQDLAEPTSIAGSHVRRLMELSSLRNSLSHSGLQVLTVPASSLLQHSHALSPPKEGHGPSDVPRISVSLHEDQGDDDDDEVDVIFSTSRQVCPQGLPPAKIAKSPESPGWSEGDCPRSSVTTPLGDLLRGGAFSSNMSPQRVRFGDGDVDGIVDAGKEGSDDEEEMALPVWVVGESVAVSPRRHSSSSITSLSSVGPLSARSASSNSSLNTARLGGSLTQRLSSAVPAASLMAIVPKAPVAMALRPPSDFVVTSPRRVPPTLVPRQNMMLPETENGKGGFSLD